MPEDKRYYIGTNKPMIKVSHEVVDRYAWQRQAGAKKLGIPESELADEPDEMADHSDDQGYDNYES